MGCIVSECLHVAQSKHISHKIVFHFNHFHCPRSINDNISIVFAAINHVEHPIVSFYQQKSPQRWWSRLASKSTTPIALKANVSNLRSCFKWFIWFQWIEHISRIFVNCHFNHFHYWSIHNNIFVVFAIIWWTIDDHHWSSTTDTLPINIDHQHCPSTIDHQHIDHWHWPSTLTFTIDYHHWLPTHWPSTINIDLQLPIHSLSTFTINIDHQNWLLTIDYQHIDHWHRPHRPSTFIFNYWYIDH